MTRTAAPAKMVGGLVLFPHCQDNSSRQWPVGCYELRIGWLPKWLCSARLYLIVTVVVAARRLYTLATNKENWSSSYTNLATLLLVECGILIYKSTKGWDVERADTRHWDIRKTRESTRHIVDKISSNPRKEIKPFHKTPTYWWLFHWSIDEKPIFLHFEVCNFLITGMGTLSITRSNRKLPLG